MSTERLFIELYLDEDVSVLLADLLKARGFNAETARDANLLSQTDRQQLAYAVSQKKTLLTHNRRKRVGQVDLENDRDITKLTKNIVSQIASDLPDRMNPPVNLVR